LPNKEIICNFAEKYYLMDKKGKILIIDDNEDVLLALNMLLTPYMENIKVSTSPEKLGHYQRTFKPDVILLDMNFGRDVVSGKEGFNWLRKVIETDPDAIVILMTAYADTTKAVQAIKAGATDFISKPWQREKLLATVFSALKLKESRRQVEYLKAQVSSLSMAEPVEVIGESEAMLEIFAMIEKLSMTETNILLLGENGTGKDLMAREIYINSLRRDKVSVLSTSALSPKRSSRANCLATRRALSRTR
jgi:DNA-binding NtrC family response regulator